MSKVMKILLSASMVVLIIALWVGCSSTSGSSTSGSNQSASSSTQNKPESTGQQTANPSDGQQPGNRPMGGGNFQMNQVAVRAAEILGISEDEFLTAFQTAMSNHMPEGPGGEGQEPPQGEPPESMGEPPEQPEGEPPEMQQGQQGGQGPAFGMEEIYEEMAGILGISADDIADAFEQAQQELSQ
jgi:hypothetical protein